MDKRPQRSKSSRGGRPPGTPAATPLVAVLAADRGTINPKAPLMVAEAIAVVVHAEIGIVAKMTVGKRESIQFRRVTKVVKGGKKLSFRAVVVVGNGQGQVGIGIGKSNEVIGAIQKGVAAARRTG